ncbi:DUF726 domain-containing protein [Arcobacter sp. F2176]|uniref:DUF726 domain-containing protein n=1 Tax=Arcobacter sp. F2176 TaxID=2044511 RepID=UPI00100B6DFB|nr:DUF726 domain-containing protein [Arcobacter sp. F2176]RXJ80303.1 hypothetical protein CRU95_11500 [Arcobacter sp. F2176]
MKKNNNDVHIPFFNEEIKILKKGKNPIVVCINGFLTEKDNNSSENWINSIESIFPDSTVTHVLWESENLKKVSTFISKLYSIKQSSFLLLIPFSLSFLGILLKPAIAFFTYKNSPWNKVSNNANEVGKQLAQSLINSSNNQFILIGHSLGAKVICTCLKELERNNYHCIKEVHLLAGAADRDSIDFNTIKDVVSYKIYNYYSNKDYVLKLLYNTNNFLKLKFSSSPIGLKKTMDSFNSKVVDIDVSNEISNKLNNHSDYHSKLKEIIIHTTNLRTTELDPSSLQSI